MPVSQMRRGRHDARVMEDSEGVWERCRLHGAHSQMNEPVGGIKTRREGNGDRR
jgi:hypothetical protein